MDDEKQTGSYLDMGLFMQNLMLAGQQKGLATCPQAALVEYTQQIKSILNYPAGTIMVCGLPLGNEYLDTAVNQ